MDWYWAALCPASWGKFLHPNDWGALGFIRTVWGARSGGEASCKLGTEQTEAGGCWIWRLHGELYLKTLSLVKGKRGFEYFLSKNLYSCGKPWTPLEGCNFMLNLHIKFASFFSELMRTAVCVTSENWIKVKICCFYRGYILNIRCFFIFLCRQYICVKFRKWWRCTSYYRPNSCHFPQNSNR